MRREGGCLVEVCKYRFYADKHLKPTKYKQTSKYNINNKYNNAIMI